MKEQPVAHCGQHAAPSQKQEQENEHAGGSLNGPSHGQSPQVGKLFGLGASPNTDTGGECVLVPRSLLVSMVNLCDVTKLGLHGTPWAQSELKELQSRLKRRLAASPPAQEQELRQKVKDWMRRVGAIHETTDVEAEIVSSLAGRS